MITMKFGGTSMGSAESIGEHVVPIIRHSHQEGERPAVVVSAMSGVTNLFLRSEELIRSGENNELEVVIGQIRERHNEAISTLLPDNGWNARGYVDRVCHSLRQPLRDNDEVIGWGECLSAHTLSCVLNARGVPAEFVDLFDIVPKGLSPDNKRSFFERLQYQIRERLMGILEGGRVPVITGFFGPIPGGIEGVFGRGYSDLCGSVTAVAIGAGEYRNYTDVDGIYSADPRTVDGARIVERATFREVAELAGNGGKVLHPTTVTPVLEKGIPIRVMNTFNPESEGTVISDTAENAEANFKFVTCKRGAVRIDIETPNMLGESGYLAKIGEVFSRHGVVVDLISTSEISLTVTIDKMPEDQSALMADLQRIGTVNVEKGNAIISVVGREISNNQQIIGRILSALSENGIHFSMISMGNGLISINIAVPDEQAADAVRVIHGLRGV